MPLYDYKARDPMGKQVRGAMDAASQTELTDKLQKMGYMVTRVSEASGDIRWAWLEGLGGRIGAEDIIVFNVQLSNLINAGIGLLSSLKTIHLQTENKKLKEIIGDISRNVEAGESFSEALARTPRVFPKLFISMIQAGEASGKLDTILARYALYVEQQADLKEKIQGALLYPAILLLAGIIVSLLIVTFLIPQFAEIFLKVGIPLPLPTRILYEAGMAIKKFWFSIGLLMGAVWVAGGIYAGTGTGKLQWDRFTLGLPVFGPLLRKAAISRFARTLGMLVTAAVPILPSLDIVKRVIGNEVLARIIGNTRSAVEKGERISAGLKISGEFPLDAIQMILVGEETGNLDKMLDKISDFYDRAVGYTVKKLTTVLEPVLLGFMGCIVGFIMASMLLPMFDMVKILKH